MAVLFYCIGVVALRNSDGQDNVERELFLKMELPFESDASPIYEVVMTTQFLHQMTSATVIGVLSALLVTLVSRHLGQDLLLGRPRRDFEHPTEITPGKGIPGDRERRQLELVPAGVPATHRDRRWRAPAYSRGEEVGKKFIPGRLIPSARRFRGIIYRQFRRVVSHGHIVPDWSGSIDFHIQRDVRYASYREIVFKGIVNVFLIDVWGEQNFTGIN